MSRLMKLRGNVWLPVGSMAALVLVAATAIGFNPGGTSRVDRARADALLSPKADLDEMKGERNTNIEEAIGANRQLSLRLSDPAAESAALAQINQPEPGEVPAA